MNFKANRHRSGKGSVQLKVSNGRLQLVFFYTGRRHYLSLGLSDNKVNRKAVEAKAKLIEADLAFDRFDPTLAKYKPQSLLSALTPISTPMQPKNLQWLELWQKYTDYKSSQVAASTLARDYGKIKKRIQAMPDLYEAVTIRDWLLNKYSAEVARRTLVQLNACGNWAVRSQLLEQNPFKDMACDIKKVRRATSRKSFSASERDAIIQAFENNTYIMSN